MRSCLSVVTKKFNLKTKSIKIYPYRWVNLGSVSEISVEQQLASKWETDQTKHHHDQESKVKL